MNSQFNKKQLNKKIKSLDKASCRRIKKVIKKKKKFNRSVINVRSPLYVNDINNTGNFKDQDEISILSNANLNILKILNSCANEEIINDSPFIVINDRHNYKKENSVESISKWRSPILPLSPVIKKKREINSSKNNFLLNSNISDLNSEIIFSEKKKESLKSVSKFYNSQNKKNSEKEIKKENSLKKKKRIEKMRHVSEINLNKLTLNKINSKNEEKNNKYNSNINNVNDNKQQNINNKQHHNYNNHQQHRQRSKSILFGDSNFLSKRPENISNISETIMANNNNGIKGFLNEIEIMKINENIHNDINFIQLRKKISKLKKNIENKTLKEFSKFKTNKSNSNSNSPINKKGTSPMHKVNKINTIDEGNENIENTSLTKDFNDTNKKNIEEIMPLSKNSTKKVANIKDKFRIIIRRKELYDSLDNEEYKEEEIDFYISPDSLYIRLFDSILFISSMIYFIFVPYFLSRNYFVIKEYKFWKVIFLLIDIIYIIDLIVNFFRAYKNFDENLIRRIKQIFMHYLKTWFLLDFIQAIPYFSILKFLENINDNNDINYKFIEYNTINPKLYGILLIKIIKVYKMLNSNSTISFFSEILSRNELIDDHGGFIIIFFIALLILNLTTCLFIFIGINIYPGWIIRLNLQDQSYLYIYLVSVYFVIVTITTVGYGDITGKSNQEILFQIYLLIIGTIAYSFTISYISNYIIKLNNKSMTFEKNLEILHEIKLHHPNMKNSLYNEVLRNIYNEQLYEKKDKHVLFDCLPYSLKNKLITEMYRTLIKNFVFFKDIDNSDFIVKVVTSLKPLITIKGDVVIQEGDYIKEIIFVKKGVIGLNICIDINEPEISIRKYLGKNKIGKFDTTYIQTISNTKTFSEKLHTFFNENLNNNRNDDSHYIESSTYRYNNIEDIKVIEIRSREHFGDALMFLNERCPLVAKVRTRNAELLILRKMEAIEIYSVYPNIWKRINKKSLYNMEQIYLKIKKLVIEISNRYKINIDNLLKKKSRSTIKKSGFMTTTMHSKFEEKEKEENNISKSNCENSSNKGNKENNIDKKKGEIILQEKKVEFNENMNNQNVENNSNRNMSMNMVENITFLKKNTTKKESRYSRPSKKDLEKISLLKMSLITNNNNINHNNICEEELHEEFIKINTFLNKSLNEITKKRSFSEKKKNDCLKHSSIYPKTLLSKLSKEYNDSNFSNASSNLKSNLSSLKNNLYKKSLSNNEKLLYNTFTNLTTTQENTFQLNSSYDNINKISNNKYIKDINLQSKIKQVLINECSHTNIKNIIKKKNTFLKLPSNRLETPKSSQKVNLNSFNNFFNETQVENNPFELINNEHNNSMIYKGSIKTENDKENNVDSHNRKTRKDKLESSCRIFQLKITDKIFSSRNTTDTRKIKTNMIESRKLKKKKKPEKINKQLNIISKNIKNTSKNINNPEEFYFNLFNNIIAKESKSYNGDEEDNNNNASDILNEYSETVKKESILSVRKKDSNILNQNSETKKEKDSVILNQNSGVGKKESNLTFKKKDSNMTIKSSLGEQNSLFSNSNLKDSNLNIVKIKTKRKSGFNLKFH